jgi:glutaminyl-tRNA synthetase
MNQFAATGIPAGLVIQNARELAELFSARDSIPRATLHAALSASAQPGFTASKYLTEGVISDASALDPVIDRILAAHPGQVEAYRAGKGGLLGFFVGQVMKETQGKANARVVSDRVRDRLRT